MLATGIQLFRTTRGEVLTTGDADGVLPPRMFVEAVNIEVKREPLLPGAEHSHQNIEHSSAGQSQ